MREVAHVAQGSSVPHREQRRFRGETAAMPDMGDRGRLSGIACEIVSGIARRPVRGLLADAIARLRIERAIP